MTEPVVEPVVEAAPTALLNGEEAAPVADPPAERPADPPTEKPAEDPAKPKEDKPAEGAPEAYADFKAPEGVTLEKESLDAFKAVAKENGLSQEKAQGLVDLAVKHVDGIMKKQMEGWNATREGWVNSLKSDKDYGGDNFPKTLEAANRALRKFGSPELISSLVNTGFGDNNEMVKMLVRVDKAISEGTFVEGNTVNEKPELAKRLYPSMN